MLILEEKKKNKQIKNKMQPNHRNNSSKQEKRFTGQYLPKLNSLTNATPFPQLLNDINVSLTGFASSTEK